MGIITSKSPLAFHTAFQLFSRSNLIGMSLCNSILKKCPGTNVFQLENTLSAHLVLYFITSSRGVWILPLCWEELTVFQISQKNKLTSGNLQIKVNQCCCVVFPHSCLLDSGTFFCLHGNKRPILQLRRPCNVGRLIRAEKELALHSPSDGKIQAYREGDLGAEALFTSLSYKFMKRFRAASTVAFSSKLLFQDTVQN